MWVASKSLSLLSFILFKAHFFTESWDHVDWKELVKSSSLTPAQGRAS